MKNSNILNFVLLVAVIILIYQVIDMKKEINDRPSGAVSNNGNVNMTGGLNLNQISNSSGSTVDGFWLYKENEKQVYFFRYDKETNKIEKIMRSIYDQR
jgi:hypothetical protein